MQADSRHSAVEALRRCPEDASQCGQPVVRILEYILASLSSTSQFASTAERCLMLKEQADEAIATYPYAEVPDHWRRLYMDASLLHVISKLMTSAALEEAGLLELVRLLDMANIVTAYFDNGRREVLFGLLELVQSQISSQEVKDQEEPPSKRQRRHGKSPASQLPSESSVLSGLLPDITLIRTYSLDDAPDMSELAMHEEPFVVKGGVSNWPAISDSTTSWAKASYLLEVAGRGRIVPVEIGSSYTSEGWTQKMIQFEDFLREIDWDASDASASKNDNAKPVLYLAQHDLFQQFPELLKDIVTPDYVWSEPGPPQHYPEYTPPNVPAGYTINAWMGPKNTYSPAHTDPHYNCYAQVVGRKHIWVAPPACTLAMEGHSDGPDDQAEDSNADCVNAAAQQYMDNTAQIDVFEASRGQHGPSLPMHLKRFRENVLPLAKQAILEEGDLLFMPPKWWHSLRSLERSFSVSMWF